jgi:hypothetical protein
MYVYTCIHKLPSPALSFPVAALYANAKRSQELLPKGHI